MSSTHEGPDTSTPDDGTSAAASAPSSDQRSSLGISPNVAGLLAYVAGWFSGLIILLLEKEHAEVRFHAAQSILVTVALVAVSFVGGFLAIVPLIGPFLTVIITALTTLGGFVLWIYLLVQGFRLNHVELPVVGAYAAKLAVRA
jgi:uncharacterized membrane protein